jgi:hypothetical protein
VISDLTKAQLAGLSLLPDRPLLICDVDEVIVHFVREFEEFLADQQLVFNIRGFHLADDSVTARDGKPLGIDEILAHITRFFAERTATMKPIEGAIGAINQISREAQVVFLTNLPAEAGDDRRKNLRSMGLLAPVVTNTGPKGPAIRELASRVSAPIAFVDDSPGFIQSSFEYAPHVKTVHFLHDERFHPHAPNFDFLGLRSDNWTDTHAYLQQALT